MDFTNKYNTRLTPLAEMRFRAWLMGENNRQERNVGQDLYDYDLRGMWNAGGGFGGDNGHAGDTWKKPNHPTFSTDSIYNGQDGFQGGVWRQTPDGITYTASPSNTWNHDELRRYFDEHEPGVRAILDALLK